MDRVVCVVCEKPIEGQAIEMGNRPYCGKCHARVMRNRRGLWWASLIGVAALLAFVGLVALIFNFPNWIPEPLRGQWDHLAPIRLEGAALVLVGVILALVPAIIWLALFYIQDVREPEPKHLVLAVFVLGGLLAQAVGIPLIEQVFRAPEWLPTSTLYHILGGILVVGVVQQSLIYAAVRYSVYYTAEFDERVDGIVYATAAALGYATVVNLRYVVDSGGVDLVHGVIRIVVTGLALASFGGLVGYFLGRCKFEDEPAWWMPAGLVLAAVLDGLFTYLRREVTTTTVGLQGGGYNPWLGLLLGAVVATATFGVLFVLIRRLGQRAPQAPGA